MRKIALLLVFFVLYLVPTKALAYNFDQSAFRDSTVFKTEFDDMDDTGMITLAEGSYDYGSTDDNDGGIIIANYDIRIIEAAPPTFRISIAYIGDKSIMCNKVILKPANTRYTFEVNRNTDSLNGKIMEMYVLALSDESIGIVRDIIVNDVTSTRFRLDGDRDVDGNLFFNVESLKKLYEAYVASGALNNDFDALKAAFPCTIK